MTIKALFPTVRPTLNLDFANTKTLDPRVTFTRASTGTFVGSNGLIQTAATNVPRFDHGPTTGESLGLLVEEARTNLILQSEDLLTTWTANDGLSRTANQVVAPNGSTTADLLASNGTLIGYLEQPNASSNQFVSGTAYTYSVYLKKANTSTCVTLLFGSTFNSGGGNPAITWNLDTGIPTFTNGATGSMTAVGNGWYRCIVTDTATQTETRNQQWLRMASGSGDVYAWGAQLEAGSFPTSYIPTTSATVTRAADVASITGTNFSSWYNQTEGTFYSENRIGGFQANNYPNVFSANDSTNNNIINNYRLDYAIRYTYGVTAGGVLQTSFNQSPAIAAGAVAKMATAVATNNGILVVNGTEQGADSSLTMPTGINRLQIPGGGDMTIKRLTYWPVRLSNTTLQAITTP